MTDIDTAISTAAERMRRHRRRRRNGLNCYTVQLRFREVDELIRRGILHSDHRNNRHDVIDAIHRFFEGSLSRTARSRDA
jgi:hypothetical protein